MKKSVKQAIFTKVFKHINKQGPCTASYFEPRYQYKNKSCAIGCLIPKDQYKRGIEFNPVEEDKVWKVLVNLYPSLTNRDKSFMNKLQLAHDDHYTDQNEKPAWLKEMRKIAKNYHLLMPK